jgi:RHS repeat-associated protein
MVDKRDAGWAAASLCCLLAASCGGNEAQHVVSTLAARPGAPIEPGLATGLSEDGHGFTAHFDAKAGTASAHVVFPKQSNGRVHLEDATSGAVVAFRLRGVRPVDAETGDGYVVYRGALESGATVLHRALLSGTEDYVAFDTRPAEPKLTYELSLGPNVAGLRLVEGTLEMLDRDGAPRLRVEPPFVVGADGARTFAALSVEGCAVDGNPAAPWGREVTPPGAESCAVVVAWADAEVRYPAVLDPRWTTTGSMASARQDHTATLLPLTGKVLVVGGRTSGTSTTGLTSAELYDGSTGTWAATGSISGGRWSHTATVLNSSSNGTTSQKVLIAGGINGTASLNTAQLYSQTAGTWVAAGTLNAARHLHTATLLADGRVLVAGGMSGTTVLTSAALYNPASGSGSWAATTGSIPPPGWRSGTATLIQTSNSQLNNKVLLAGGNGGTSTLGSTFLFDPAQSAFSTLAAMPSPREGHTATPLANGKILFAGGKNGSSTLATAVVFDPSFGPGSWSTTGNMSSPRSGHTASLLPTAVKTTGQVLVAGGSNGTSTLSSTEVWNGSTWTTDAAMVAPVQQHRAVVLGNKVLIVGGVNGSSTVSAAELYDPSFGLSCTTGTQCASGFCANGVCCDTACNSGCGACNLTGKVGTCSPLAGGTVCRMAAGECDLTETCNGSSTSCPADAKKASGTACTDDGNACTQDQCNGSSVACQHPVGNAGAVCRASQGVCDVAEVCSGTSATCPADGFAPATTICSPAVGGHGAETCTGTSAVCPVSGEASDVLGFEALADWSASSPSGTVVGLSTTHTQGLSSLEVTAQGLATFTSAPVVSIGSVGTEMLLDIMLPQSQANPSSFGTVQLSVNSPSLAISNVSLGQVNLTGLPLQVWQTVSFPVSSAVSAKLSAGGYSDLTFTISLNVDPGETGHYLFDNLRAVADVVPSLFGIATDSSGNTKAVFTYTTAAATVSIPYGPSNSLSDQNGFLATPKELPPQTFVSETHAPFVATLAGSALTWRIGTHTATATAASTQLPTVSAGDGTKDAVLPDGRKVNLDSTPPQPPTATADPPVGGTDDGVLSGDLQITPSGAAVYSLPIMMAPGVRGMAPNLGLVYNSQGQDGLAGQGADLAGLSMIHKCPRTQLQDGVARAVLMLGDPTSTSGTNTDGICLDGQRLFEGGSNTYVPEKKDFSTITYFPSDNHFEVKTKTNEIRYYGLTSNARVVGHGLDAQNNTTTATAIWALERVTDAWGNFYYVHYNLDNADFAQTGLRVTEIDYTGHMSASGAVDTPPFASVKFGYEARPDVRWTRFAQSKFPRNQRLKTITTDRGTYTLTYEVDPAGLISQLLTIHYCTGATCLKDLTFSWGGGATVWNSSTGYALPSDIPTGHGLLGTQFIDLDGDGRIDLVYASQDHAGGTLTSLAWLNTGTGWTPASSQLALPAPLARGGVPTGARFADMDGDGVVDFVIDSPSVGCAASCAGPSVWLNRFADGLGWVSHPEFSTIPSTSTFATLQPIRFNAQTFCDGTNADPANGFCEGFQHMTLLPASVVDINGDGLMDIVRVEEGGAGPNLTAANLEVLLNQGPGVTPTWVRYSEPILTDETLNFNSEPGPSFGDLNRDGFPDLIRENYYAPASPTANQPNQLSVFQQIALNARTMAGVQQFDPTMSRSSCTVAGNGSCGGGFRVPFGTGIADLDGDGLYDEVLFGALNDLTTSTNLASGFGVAMNDGTGPRLSYSGDAAGYANELSSIVPFIDTAGGVVFPEDFAYTLADINGDGMPDLVLNHGNCFNSLSCAGDPTGLGGGQVLYNSGTTWGSGHDKWQRSAGPGAVPGVVPSALTAGCGGTFVDLNGDGIVDFLQEEGNNGTTCNESLVGRGAWLNNASPPFITGFPNDRAQATTVSYIHITEPKAHTAGVDCDGVNANAVYCDDISVAPGTKRLAVPMRVVFKVTKGDGTGNGTTADTTYAYHSLRMDANANGRGPLGFQRVIVYDHASGVKTDTTYAQGYPYTGMPTEVARSQVTQNNAPLSDTQTKYCDTTAVRADGTLNCSPPGTKYAPQTSLFVYPFDVFDQNSIKQDASGNQMTTESSYQYDDFGNSKQVIVNTRILAPSAGSPITTSSLTATTVNQYGSSGSEEEKQGKITDTLVTTSGDPFLGITSHHTTSTYTALSTFGGASSTALALTKKEIEPGSGWPTQEDTAYSYDPFGNLVITTMCANDFDSCAPSVTSPSPVAVDHPPFRTTTVSFNTGDFNRPAGPGLINALSYGTGRFPVRTITNTINAGGGGTDHVEYSAYDPIKGVLLQKTAQDGIHTCYTFDDLGRPTSEIARCGSSAPITSTTAYFQVLFVGTDIPLPAAGTPFNTRLITVARSASGATTWAFTDDQGKIIEKLARNFDGGFIETVATYNAMGQVLTATKPFGIENFTDTPAVTYKTTTTYDGFNRVFQVTDDLGGVGDSGATKQLLTTTTYDGLTLTTTRAANQTTQTRTETKNLLGKLDSVVDSLGGEIDYTYDPDGNVVANRTPDQLLIVTFYDARGRKTQMTDQDLGTWNYVFDGFGDLVSQTDANNQQFAMAYDQLGRLLTKQNLGTTATAQWIYDAAGGAGIGKLAAMVSEPDPNLNGACGLPSGAVVSGGNRAVKSYAYTALGDLQAVAECADGDTFQTSYEYDTIARQSLIRYPMVNGKQLAVGYHYTGLGHLQYLSDESSDYGILWQAKAMDPFGNVTDELARNGVEALENRSPGNGWLVGSTSTAHSDANTIIQNWTYTFDEVGNLLSRQRADHIADAPFTETFTYDALNRVRVVDTNVGAPINAGLGTETFYDSNGNITQKDGKTYNYGGCQGPGRSGNGLHQVCSIDNGPTFVYDAAGNLTSTGDRTVVYNAHNKATQVTSTAGTLKFMYGADEARVVQAATTGTTTSRTVYVGLGGTGKSMYERTTTGTTVQHTNFIYAGSAHGGNAFAVRLMANDGSTTASRYLSFDHLGSTTAVSDEKGHIAAATGPDTELLGYDSWGARRNPDGQPASPSDTFPSSAGHRDFTGQETVPSVGLINMNGRMYDPVLARFLSPDPKIQTLSDLQNYNRYSYVLNNPLRYVDPTGYDFWSSLGNYFSNPLNDIELVASIAACGLGGPVACMVMGAALTLINASVALAEGASFEQTALNIGIGLTVGLITSGAVGAAVGPAGNPIASIIAGAASAAATTAIIDLVSGRSLGWDVFWAGALSAAQGAAIYGVQQAVLLSQTEPVKLSLNLHFVDQNGNPLPAAVADQYIQDAEDAWTGRYGKYDVIADFNDPNATDVTVHVYPGAGQSQTLPAVGGNDVDLYTGGYQRPGGPVQPYTPADVSEVLSHEIGHVLGAQDQYNLATGIAYPGHETDIMGAMRPTTNRPFESTMVEILRFNGETP